MQVIYFMWINDTLKEVRAASGSIEVNLMTTLDLPTLKELEATIEWPSGYRVMNQPSCGNLSLSVQEGDNHETVDVEDEILDGEVQSENEDDNYIFDNFDLDD